MRLRRPWLACGFLASVIVMPACDPPEEAWPAVIAPGAPVVVESDDAPAALREWGVCADGSQPVVDLENRRIGLVCPEGALRLRTLCEGPVDAFLGAGLLRIECLRSFELPVGAGVLETVE